MAERPRHPSGRPIRKEKIGVRSIFRIPQDGYELPKLRQVHKTEAIGFTARLCADDYDYEDDE